MGRPCRRGYEVAICEGFVHPDLDVPSAGKRHLGSNGRVGRAGSALHDAGGRQELDAVADRGYTRTIDHASTELLP